MVAAGHRTPPLDVVESLPPAAQALWNELMVPIPADERAAAETYVGAREYLEGRPDFQAYETIREAAEKAQRRKELETRYPSAAKKYLLGLIGKRLRQPR